MKTPWNRRYLGAVPFCSVRKEFTEDSVARPLDQRNIATSARGSPPLAPRPARGTRRHSNASSALTPYHKFPLETVLWIAGIACSSVIRALRGGPIFSRGFPQAAPASRPRLLAAPAGGVLCARQWDHRRAPRDQAADRVAVSNSPTVFEAHCVARIQDERPQAEAAGRSLPTIKRLEREHDYGAAVSDDVREAVRRALEKAGVEFIAENGGGAGVRLAKRGRRK
jgi:hypothetical protein